MKCVFLGTPEFAVPSLEKLNEVAEVSLVVTQADRRRGRGKKLSYSPVKEKAIELGIEVFQPENINDALSIEKLKSVEADLFVVVAYGQLLSTKVLEIPKLDIVNVHASLLPKYRGASPIQASILNGDKKTGVSIMRVEEGMDSGPVAVMKELVIGNDDTEALSERLSILGAEALVEFVHQLENKEAKFTSQDDAKASYVGKITKEMGKLNFNENSAKQLLSRMRAMSPRPGAYFTLDGENYKVFNGKVHAGNKEPGKIIIDGDKLFISAKEGILEITEIQRPGKRKMDTSSFLAGMNWSDGMEIDQ